MNLNGPDPASFGTRDNSHLAAVNTSNHAFTISVSGLGFHAQPLIIQQVWPICPTFHEMQIRLHARRHYIYCIVGCSYHLASLYLHGYMIIFYCCIMQILACIVLITCLYCVENPTSSICNFSIYLLFSNQIFFCSNLGFQSSNFLGTQTLRQMRGMGGGVGCEVWW